ncbi:MAG: DUF3857 and transglutaminase domain-containing protein [Acidobacteriota bacterium]|nr:DUF3857 and transglutaminase domain-containing protein [Acidobacteriota bacterium]
MRTLFALSLLCAAVPLWGADAAPDWVKELSTRALPVYPPEVHSVTLLDEHHLTVDSDGMTARQIREAVKILSWEGRRRAEAEVQYLQKSTRIREFHAWLIAPNGAVKTYGKNDIVDRAVKADFELYDEYRARIIVAQNPEIGSTFAWSASFEEPEIIPQTIWYFQQNQPALLSRCVLTLPAGWQAKASIFNHGAITPTVEGNTYTWELKDLGPIKKEARSPGVDSLVPWMGVTFERSRADTAAAKQLSSWSDVSQWYSGMADTQFQTSEPLNAKVRELIAKVSTVYQRIQAIGRYVQKIKYVEISTNLARGGGYQPHLATDVFAKQYGDCKDKANLMRAMLRVAGIESHMVLIFSGDRNYVRAEWASPYQFNHAIIAIAVPDTVSNPAVLIHPVLGRLLIFDPTDSETPAGDLPEYEQGSYALIAAGAKGDIARMPVAPPETNRTDVSVTGSLAQDGSLEAVIGFDSRAQSARDFRSVHDYLQPVEFRKMIEAWLSREVKALELDQMDAADKFDEGAFGIRISFKAPRYAQLMQGRLLVFKPAIVEPYNRFPLQSEKRIHPLVLDSECYHKRVRVKLPANFKVDEMPDPAKFNTSFGSYSSDYKLDGNDLLFTEELDVSATTLPAERYPEARTFFEHVAGAEQAPLVLLKN